MPLPLGHTAIGLAAFETANTKDRCDSRLRLFIYVTILANLPDIDMLFGLLINGNGAAFHRGPTHSLLFAITAGFIATQMGRLWRNVPSLGFGLNTLLIFSHVIADMLFTTAPVSLFWPLELNWSTGYAGWMDVIDMALFQSIRDLLIAVVAGVYMFGVRYVRQKAFFAEDKFAVAKNRIK